ncbi:cytochrome c-type biogenesis protein CcmH [Serratia microhaemolytica]|uniref:cytochrome c-type biogenesis protein CcmH n=1 Tax=Serratia microhaemolytica TaxID=2675110 RepID=UPI001F0C31CC|nr:cytochrome c-type biogenesis protein CcmH [Serratia microhaemolytica]
MRILMIMLFCCWLAPALADIVDTWAFSSTAMQKKALSIAGQIRCPQCQNQNVLESSAPVAVAMRHEIFTMVEQGKSRHEVIAAMTERYGNFVRYQPALSANTLALWLLPGLLLAAISWLLWRARSRR